jgi:hypothetical protein
MAFSRDWTAAYENSPADSDDASEGATRIRNLKVDVRERMAVDHRWKQDDYDGEHEKVTLRVQSSAPAAVADKGFVFALDVGGKAELHYRDEDGNSIQITSGGSLNTQSEFSSGTKMVFYQDTAPTGWTIDTTLDDKVIMVTKGSAAGGEIGGAVHSAGTWTQPDHTHTFSDGGHTHGISSDGAHTHTVVSGTTVPYSTSYTLDLTSEGAHSHGGATGSTISSGTTGAGATANTWRPAAYNCIICSKD